MMASAPSVPLTIHEAVCARDGTGGVFRGQALTRAQAVARRRREDDVVVCGPDPFANAREAHVIETAVGPCKPDGPHADVAGVKALPHFQQKAPPPEGHTFYEVPTRKAVPTP
jgi:hypothetical protein